MKVRYLAVLALAGLTVGPAKTATSQIRDVAVELTEKFDGRSWLYGRIGGKPDRAALSTEVKAAARARFDSKSLPFVPGAYQSGRVYLTPSSSGSLTATSTGNAVAALPAAASGQSAPAISAATVGAGMAVAGSPSAVDVIVSAATGLPTTAPGNGGANVASSATAGAASNTSDGISTTTTTTTTTTGNTPAGNTGPIILVPATPMPEPSTWAMLILGFGLIGTSIRRRTGRVSLV